MKKFIFFLLLTVVSISARGSDFDWQTYTSMFNINDVCYRNGIIWCATDGGFFGYDPQDQEFISWTNTEGLVSNKVTALEAENNDIIWLGFDNGLIQKFDMNSYQFETVYDYKDNIITSLKFVGDSLFVGLDIGLSLYILSRSEVKETYRQLGYDIQVELPVKDICIARGKIWAATEQGLACSELGNTNLLDPSNWENIVSADGLPSSAVTSVVSFENIVYAGTDSGIAKNENNEWVCLYGDDYYNNAGIRDIAINQTDMYVLAENGVYKLINDRLNRIGSGFFEGITLMCTDLKVWAGTDRGLKYCYYSLEEWNDVIPDCPKDNRFSDLTVDKNGKLWCMSAARDGTGFSLYDGEKWTVYDKLNIPGLKSESMCSVVEDNSGNIWIGTWGGGIVLIRNDSTFQFFNAENGYLGGIPNFPNYAVVSDMMVDHNGTVWILNYKTDNDFPLISVVKDSVTQDFIWTYYEDSNFDILLRTITEDIYGRKWIGSDNKGVFVFYDNNTPADKSDDTFAGTLNKSDGLDSNEIKALAADKTGGVWIGTASGLYYYFNSLTRNYQVPSQYVQALLIDGFSNLWVGTDEGISFFPSGSYYGEHFNADNSPLASNDVNSFVLDNFTGNLYTGTSKGLSCIKTPYAEPEPNLENLIVYPNPFKPDEHVRVTIDNLAENSAVSIYTPSGYLVKSFSQEEIKGKLIYWNGKNEAGEYTASGVYLVVAAIEDGKTKVAKLAVVK